MAIPTQLVDAIKNFLIDKTFDKRQLRVQAKIRIEYCLMAGKENLFSDADEDKIKELYYAVTGKPWTRDIAMESQDYDS